LERLLVISSNLGNIDKVRMFLEEIFAESNLNRSYFNKVFLGLSEALTNSIVHGNKLNASKKVCIEVNCLVNELFIEITDEGNGFLFDYLRDPTCLENLKKENGRGIFLIRHYADEVEYFDSGRKVRIKYNLNR
jgi:serine/threonine-protein kinase RsbW